MRFKLQTIHLQHGRLRTYTRVSRVPKSPVWPPEYPRGSYKAVVAHAFEDQYNAKAARVEYLKHPEPEANRIWH